MATEYDVVILGGGTGWLCCGHQSRSARLKNSRCGKGKTRGNMSA